MARRQVFCVSAPSGLTSASDWGMLLFSYKHAGRAAAPPMNGRITEMCKAKKSLDVLLPRREQLSSVAHAWHRGSSYRVGNSQGA